MNAATDLRAALARGEVRAAAARAAEVLKRDPRDADAHFAVGIALAEAGRIIDALGALEAAARFAPADAEVLAQLARVRIMARREEEAREAANKAAALAPADPMVLDTIGCVLARLGDHAGALPLFEKAVAGAPEEVEYRFNLATTLGFFGRTTDAALQYEAIIARAPEHGRAHLGLSGLSRKTEADNHIRRLEAAIPAAADPADRLRFHYAAAKEYEDLSRHEDTFRHLAAGNAAHKARIGYDIARDERIFAAVRTAFAQPSPSSTDCPADAPVFVVGLPRTGTTLVDRILSAHPEMRSAGELQAMPLAVKQLSGTRSRLVLDEETVAAMTGVPSAAVARAYMARARQHAGAEAGRFTDKFPLNFLYIGWIAAALPNARIVCLRRGTMDSVWSTFKHLFATTSPYYGWSYDTMDAARYFAAFDALMAFWHERLPGRILDVQYEGIVADQESETRRLLTHCGLTFDPACLDFHRQAGPVATPSAQQVRQPVNARSVGRWREHETALAPVCAFFAAKGIPLD